MRIFNYGNVGIISLYWGDFAVFLVFLFFWTIAVFLWISEKGSMSNFFGGLAFFFFGCGGLSAFIGTFSYEHKWLLLPVALLSSFMYFWGPFSILMYSMYAASYMPKKRWQRIILTQAFMVPVEAAYFAFPALSMFGAVVEPIEAERIFNTRIMTLMMAPYFLATTVILLVSWIREKDIVLREEKAVNCLLIIPPGFLLFLSSYVIPSTGYVGAWQFNIVLILAVTALFLFFGIRRSVMGFHLFQENASKQQTQQAVIRGTGVLHHALKNNLLTTHLALQNANYHVDNPDGDDKLLRKDLSLALTTCEHTLNILERINMQFQPIRIQPEACSINEIIGKAVESSKSSFHRKNLVFQTEFLCDTTLLCDPVHMHESVLNIVNNAAEAVPEDGDGEIKISTFARRGRLVIQVQDNGCGIEKKDWKYIYTPLFTTKRGKSHYGLGLYYVKRVAELHQAQFYLRTGKKAGTIAEICFQHRVSETEENR